MILTSFLGLGKARQAAGSVLMTMMMLIGSLDKISSRFYFRTSNQLMKYIPMTKKKPSPIGF
tara:strand:+ start:743 stop:928 length:186 start_codon:yes stop_codon:yes gene_type:complete